MNNTVTKRLIFCALLSVSSICAAHDLVPGKTNQATLLIKNGTLHTVSQGILNNTDILIKGDKIVRIDTDIIENNTVMVDASGKHIYPGMIAMMTTVGLVEIEAVRASRDQAEVGSITPEVKAHIAFNADSEIIPTLRSNGITHVQVVPNGSGWTGQSSLMHLDGWDFEDALVKPSVATHFNWPRIGINKSPFESRSPSEQLADQQKRMERFKTTFKQLKGYHQARNNKASQPIDLRWESLGAMLKGEQPLFVRANDLRQITRAIEFAQQEKLRLVIVGGGEAYKAIDLLKSSNTSVIYTAPYGRPLRSDDGIDMAFKVPALLASAEIPYALAVAGSWNVRDLPFAAGHSIAYGVEPEVALASVTLQPAQLMGVDHMMGTLDVGKQANIVISSGDWFDHLTHKVEQVFIDGRQVDIDDRHKRLYRKYSAKPLPVAE